MLFSIFLFHAFFAIHKKIITVTVVFKIIASSRNFIHFSKIYIFAFHESNSPDGAFLAMGGGNSIASIVKTKTFATVHNISRDSRVTCLAWQQRGSREKGNDYSGGKYLAVGGDDRTLAVIKTKTMMGGDNDDDESIASSYSTMSMMSSASGWEMNKTFLDIDDDGSTKKFMLNWGVQESKSPTADNSVG